MGWFQKTTHHPLVSTSLIPLSLTSLSLLLLVLVLLSVPGPIKGLYWFSVPNVGGLDGPLSAGVLGWCALNTSNCTDNSYLSTLIDVGEALTVRIALPLACYWMIITLILWIILTTLLPLGYLIKDLDSISRHLRFAIIESCVLCVSVFANVLCWLAFGLGRNAYLSIQEKGGQPISGNAMETTAVAAVMSLLSLFSAVWALHLRVKRAQQSWREQAIMVRRRSMALTAAGASQLAVSLGGSVSENNNETSSSSVRLDEKTRRFSASPDNYTGTGMQRGSMVKVFRHDEEEILDGELESDRRYSRDLMRRSSVSPSEIPYGAVPLPNAQPQVQEQ